MLVVVDAEKKRTLTRWRGEEKKRLGIVLDGERKGKKGKKKCQNCRREGRHSFPGKRRPAKIVIWGMNCYHDGGKEGKYNKSGGRSPSHRKRKEGTPFLRTRREDGERRQKKKKVGRSGLSAKGSRTYFSHAGGEKRGIDLRRDI